MTKAISRRKFLLNSAAFATATLLVPSRSILAATSSSQHQYALYGNTADLLSGAPGLISRSTLASPAVVPLAIAFLSSFASGVAANVVSNFATDWIKRLSGSNRKLVKDTNKTMANSDYNEYQWSRVRERRGSYFYGVANDDGENVCAPVYTSNSSGSLRKPVMLEAPAIVGLGAAADDWHSTKVSPGDGLVPLQVLQGKCPEIGYSMNQPFECKTRAGWAGVMYEKTPGKDQGDLEVISVKGSDDVLFHKGYTVYW